MSEVLVLVQQFCGLVFGPVTLWVGGAVLGGFILLVLSSAVRNALKA